MDCFSSLSLAATSSPFTFRIGASWRIAFVISSSALLMPSATGLCRTCFPLKRAISTFLSAATMTPSARRISSAVKAFLTPSDPFVSTRISTPIFSAICFKESSAMYVCAIPVGHAVTAMTKGLFVSVAATGAAFAAASACSFASRAASAAANRACTSSGVSAFFNDAMKSGLINKRDKDANTSKWTLFAPSGAAIIKNKCAGWPSNEA